ncbi:MAG: hypothetical protein K2M73_08990 [Lachnospiraceae bacterium]|nr:hypothetical protein [Lachnospiraceae bacterium]
MIIDKYLQQLKEVERKFHYYEKNLDTIIQSVFKQISHTIITKGRIANTCLFDEERLGNKVNGKVVSSLIVSNDCMKYHYDNNNRIIMVEEYSVFLKKFDVIEIYIYREITEKLLISSEILRRLYIFDNPFGKTNLCLSYAGSNGYIVDEYVYEESKLKEILIGRDDGDSKDTFFYEENELIMIEHTSKEGIKRIKYTTKKPKFEKIRKDVYTYLKSAITDYQKDFRAIGIEGFLDQDPPHFCISFENKPIPSELIAEWDSEMETIFVWDFQFDEKQLKKCIKIIAEVIVELVQEGMLRKKLIYFHQNQVVVTQNYPSSKTVLKKAQITVL